MKPLKLRKLLLAVMICAMCAGQASAMEFTYDAPEDYLFGKPTSQDTVYEAENPNVDRSKNTALIPPGFGTPISYLPGSGEALTPNLIPGRLGFPSKPSEAGLMGEGGARERTQFSPKAETELSGLCDDAGGLVNQVGSVNYPAIDSSPQAPSTNLDNNFSFTTQPGQSQTVGFTDVTEDLYYSGGHLGTLKIPAIGLTVKVYEGTDSSTLAKGAGHFTETSIWDGNCCLAGHNRGVNNHFGKIHTLEPGDTVTFTTKLGTRTYEVASVEKVSETDSSGTAAASDNRITLYTCVRDQREYRWKVTAVEQAA